MMKKSMKRAFFFLSFFNFVLEGGIPLKERALFYSEEKVNGQIFSHRIEILEGLQKDIYKINSELVEDRQVYEDAYLEAEKEERRRERQKEYEARLAHELFKHKAQIALMKKILALESDFLRKEVRQLEKHSMEGYFLFSPETIRNHDEYDMICNDLLPHIDSLVYSGQDVPYQSFVDTLDQVERYKDRMKSFVRDTINNAIDQCDDTRALKELLLLVS